jgi:hypothetical protein
MYMYIIIIHHHYPFLYNDRNSQVRAQFSGMVCVSVIQQKVCHVDEGGYIEGERGELKTLAII